MGAALWLTSLLVLAVTQAAADSAAVRTLYEDAVADDVLDIGAPAREAVARPVSAQLRTELQLDRCTHEELGKRGKPHGIYELCPQAGMRWLRLPADDWRGGLLTQPPVSRVFGRFDAVVSQPRAVGDQIVLTLPGGDPCPATGGATRFSTTVVYQCVADDADGVGSWDVRELHPECTVFVTVFSSAVCRWAAATERHLQEAGRHQGEH